MKFTRQEGLVKTEDLSKATVTVIGVGAVGSFATLALTKLGVSKITLYDEDGVSQHNLPNQFYRVKDANNEAFKANALAQIVEEFNDVVPTVRLEKFTGKANQPLGEYVICAPDNMLARSTALEAFLKSPTSKVFIDSRMGGEVGSVYNITKSSEDVAFYRETMFTDAEAEVPACTSRAIIYNVLMISALICRAFTARVRGDEYPREVVMDIRNMIYMDRK